ncbi:hypothetical protein COCNU_03G006810 [Cocos nucifera]|uniref:Uncharacterized protein n=1 Tax=Cocos nucifera TaxID=13894 RepID=A0A8K0I2A9_COCNU|nr:hypothetical protein COCNU_03G006810 [Cocos nucifera]
MSGDWLSQCLEQDSGCIYSVIVLCSESAMHCSQLFNFSFRGPISLPRILTGAHLTQDVHSWRHWEDSFHRWHPEMGSLVNFKIDLLCQASSRKLLNGGPVVCQLSAWLISRSNTWSVLLLFIMQMMSHHAVFQKSVSHANGPPALSSRNHVEDTDMPLTNDETENRSLENGAACGSRMEE